MVFWTVSESIKPFHRYAHKDKRSVFLMQEAIVSGKCRKAPLLLVDTVFVAGTYILRKPFFTPTQVLLELSTFKAIYIF